MKNIIKLNFDDKKWFGINKTCNLNYNEYVKIPYDLVWRIFGYNNIDDDLLKRVHLTNIDQEFCLILNNKKYNVKVITELLVQDELVKLTLDHCLYFKFETIKQANTFTKDLINLNEEYCLYKNRIGLGIDSSFIKTPLTCDIINRCNEFYNSKDIYNKYGIRWRRGVLFTGKPGCGKSFLAKQIANSIVINNINIRKITHVSKDTFSAVLRTAHNQILILDEIEQYLNLDVLGKPNSDARAFLLDLIENVNDGILIIATTNKPECLDSAFHSRPGRFDEVIEIKNPTEEMINNFLKVKDCEDLINYRIKHLTFAQANEYVIRCKIMHQSSDAALDDILGTAKNEYLKPIEYKQRAPIGFNCINKEDNNE